jgi:hypothetical protein
MREASQLPQPSILDIDPEDPSQLLDEVGQFSIVPLDVEAQPSAEAAADLDAAVYESSAEEQELDDNSEVDEDAAELDTPSQTTADAYADAATDTGELYGVRTPHAADRDLDQTPDNESFVDSEQGENWLETLGKHAAEYGAEAEEEVVIIDDSDAHRGPHPSDHRDRPKADKGSGGDGGL